VEANCHWESHSEPDEAGPHSRLQTTNLCRGEAAVGSGAVGRRRGRTIYPNPYSLQPVPKKKDVFISHGVRHAVDSSFKPALKAQNSGFRQTNHHPIKSVHLVGGFAEKPPSWFLLVQIKNKQQRARPEYARTFLQQHSMFSTYRSNLCRNVRRRSPIIHSRSSSRFAPETEGVAHHSYT